MEPVLIVIVVVVVLVVVLLALATPKIRARQGAAATWVRGQLGGDAGVVRLETVANAFGSTPDDAPQLRGPGALGLGRELLVFALTPDRSMVIRLADIESVDSTTDEEDAGAKGMLEVTHRLDGRSVTSSWRLPKAYEWASALRG